MLKSIRTHALLASTGTESPFASVVIAGSVDAAGFGLRAGAWALGCGAPEAVPAKPIRIAVARMDGSSGEVRRLRVIERCFLEVVSM